MNEYIIINMVVFAILLLISRFIVWFAKHLEKNLSLYKVFGIVDVFWGVTILTIAIIEFVMPGGDLHGLFGTVMLLIFEPGAVLFLIGDIVLYRKQLNQDKQSPTSKS